MIDTHGPAYVHIGAPKTGTTYLQDRLARNALQLARAGVHVPAVFPTALDPGRAQFRAALDLLGEDWGGPAGHAVGYWDQLVRSARAAHGAVVISHEILAGARPSCIARALTDLHDREVHVVYTARDLGRELASAWPESIRKGRTWSYRAFLDRSREGRTWFARAFDLPAVLTAWGAALPPERVHVVTVPRAAGAATDTLWQRFCEALDLAPGVAPHPAERTNPSLGALQTALLRELNRRTDSPAREDPARDHYVDRFEKLIAGTGAPDQPVRLPPQDHEWVLDRCRDQIAWIEGSGVRVHGDLTDLLTQPTGAEWVDPDGFSRRELLGMALDGLNGLLATGAERSARRDRVLVRLRTRVSRRGALNRPADAGASPGPIAVPEPSDPRRRAVLNESG